jgi:hypothetical protein
MSEIDIKDIEANIAKIERDYNKAEGEVVALTRLLKEVKAKAEKRFGVTKASELRLKVKEMKAQQAKVAKRILSKKAEIDEHMTMLESEQ